MWHKRGILPERSTETVGRRPVFEESVILEWLDASGRGDYLETAQARVAAREAAWLETNDQH